MEMANVTTIGTNELNQIKDRIGRVLVDYKMLMRIDKDIVSIIFSRFFPIKAENNFMTGVIEYYGYSEDFQETEPGIKVPPTYQIKVDSVKKKVEFIKIGKKKGDDITL